MGHVVVHVTIGDVTESLRIKPRAWLEVERRFGQTVPPREGTMYAAWVQLDQPGEFEAWVDTLDAISDEWVDPQKEAAQPSEGSPPSP